MKDQLVTLEERQWIADNAVIQMGKRIKYNVIDIDKVAKRVLQKRKDNGLGMIIIIKQIQENKYKDLNSRMPWQKDPITGVFYGIPVREDEHGNISWSKVPLANSMTLNLEKLNDLKQWVVIRFHQNIKGSPFAEPTPKYEVMDPSIIAKKEIDETVILKKAFDAIDSMEERPSDMLYLLRYLGEEILTDAKYPVVYSRLLQIAKRNPVSFITAFNTSDRGYLQYIVTGRMLQIITEGRNGTLMFNNIPLGTNDAEAAKLMKKDNAIKTSLMNAIKEKDSGIMDINNSYKFEKGKEKNE